MDLRKPRSIKQEKVDGAAMPIAGSDGVMYNMAVAATDHLVQYAMTRKGHKATYNISTVTRLNKSELAEFLKDFYYTFKNSTEDIHAIREGLHKFFLNENGIDILYDKEFDFANSVFEKYAAIKRQIKKSVDLMMTTANDCGVPLSGIPTNIIAQSSPRGSPALRSSPVPYTFTGMKPVKQSRIQYESLKKLYLSEALAGNFPESLQNKVYFDVNLYIINRGKDCLRCMVKTDFEISTDETGRRYVWLKYSNKFSIREVGNAPGDERTVSGNQLGDRMYERVGDPRCPVASFLKYVTHLHPMTEAFWQRPKRQVSQTDYVWFDNTALGNSSLSKFMQKICLQAGLMDSYTNTAIRSVYIPAVESICQEELGVGVGGHIVHSPVMQVMPEPTIKLEKLDDEERAALEDASSSDSEMKSELDDRDTGRLDEQGLGLRDSKMEVLNLLQRLMVKDIQKFVDWLKTVRVEKNGGELVVLCSPVDKATIDPELNPETQSEENKGANSNGVNERLQNGEKEGEDCKNVQEASMEGDSVDDPQGISIKQVDFLSLDSTHCSSSDIRPLNITIPSKDTLLVTGVTEDTQLLVHRNSSQTSGCSEHLKDRVYFSENSVDVAEVAAILGARKKIHGAGTVSSYSSGVDCQSKLPPRKRLTDPLFNMNSPSAKRLCNIRNIDEETETDIKLETNLNCLKPATLKSLPLKHKKRVRFSSGVQAFKIKTEPVDT